eukprot:TRINITY_DN3090_c0_g1_i4.p1 TRINITY_DN3090_c0_g1~~TRINITY_DN3090_c0_g1_i4.p1  ORF type:complete len:550 (-),score=114.02 TRINITY_DN3090_c0_g1_i4:72-1721(-)
MLDRRVANAGVDFVKERTYTFPLQRAADEKENNNHKKKSSKVDASPASAASPPIPCLAMYGLYSGFKFQSRKTCQDRVLMKEIHLKNGSSYLMLGIFDGHGQNGEHCSGFVVNNIYKFMEHYLNKFPDDVQKALIKTFKRTDKMLRKFGKTNPICDVRLSGTTATCVLVNTSSSSPRVVHVAHVGDSRAVVTTSHLETRNRVGVLNLTTEHNFEDPFESERARNAGAVVDRIVINGQAQGPLRVFHASNRVRPGLAVSRSLGDGEAHTVGVSSDPDILHVELAEHEDVLILASDGIWDMMSGRMILDRLDKNGWHVKNFEKIILEAARRWIFSRTGVSDDLSMIVLRLGYDQASDQANKKANLAMDEHKPAEITDDHKDGYLGSPSTEIPQPKALSINAEFQVDVNPLVEIDSPTQTIPDEQKLLRKMSRDVSRELLPSSAPISRDTSREFGPSALPPPLNSDQYRDFEFKVASPDQLDQAAIDALETNSLPPQDRNYLLELDADMSQYSVENDSIDGDHHHDKEKEILALELEHEKERVIQLEKNDIL